MQRSLTLELRTVLGGGLLHAILVALHKGCGILKIFKVPDFDYQWF